MKYSLYQKRKSWIILLFFLSFVFLIRVIYAESGCCALDNSGIACVDVDETGCTPGELFAREALCSESAFCEFGCCYDEDAGIYDKGVLEQDCSLGSWDPDPFCNIPGADLGCCVLGDFTRFQTQGQCNSEAVLLGIEDFEWKRDVNEGECLLIPYLGDRGACVYGDNNCKFTSRDSCIKSSGSFFKDTLCTSAELNTTCKPTEYTTCLSGLDEVYFVDSCGNVANIYDSYRVHDQSYWEEIISREDSCGVGSSNADSKSCGNCNRFESSICSPASFEGFEPNIGNNYCKDLSCEYLGQTYRTGESWCVYDGAVGIDDVVGSRHWQYTCNQGVVETTGCDDYRNQICIQQNTEENGVIVNRNAECVTNTWRECLQLNIDYSNDVEKLEEECNKMVNCRFEDAKIADKFGVRACMPLYPGGFDFSEEEVQAEAEELCGAATQTCKITRKRNWVGGCDVQYNKACLNKGYFVKSMNEICRGLGDCGGEANIKGEYVQNFISSYRGDEFNYSLDSDYLEYLVSLALPIPGQYAVVDNYSEFLMVVGIYPDIFYNSSSRATVASLLNRHFASLHKAHFISSFPLVYAFSKSVDSIPGKIFGKCSSRRIEYQCLPWQPPEGGDDCETCNNDPLKPCSKYRCESLGAGCKLINTESKDPLDFLCINSCSTTGSAPIITSDPTTASKNIEYLEVSSNGFTIRGKDSSCVDPYTNIEFGITTDKPSICKFDYKQEDYDNMTEIFRNFYEYNHSTSLNFVDPNHGESFGENWTKDQTLYIKCRDNCGNENSRFYTVDLCINSGPDNSAPLVERFEPGSGSKISFDKPAVNVNVITNELATCKWAFEDEEYGEMNHEFICNDDLGWPSSPFGYLCFGELPTRDQVNDFYIACADQPWFIGTENESLRNIGKYTYILEKPDEKIRIDWIVPDSLIRIGTDKLSVDLKIKTSGGGNSHRCFYSMREGGSEIPMFSPDANGIHTQSLELYPEAWEIFVRCEDELKDSVDGKAEFEIIKDTTAPLISRVWNDLGEIYIITSEDSECKYTTTSCSFDWDDGVPIGNLQVHVIDSVPGKEYYIKCKDDLGNLPGGCSIILKAVWGV